MNQLIFQTSPSVTLATNVFINVPTILRFEDTNLIEVVKEEQLGFTTQIPIYHSDGTYLAKIRGTRIFPTEDGKKAGLKVEKLSNVWTCKIDNKIAFEIHYQDASSFKTYAELYTPEGYFVKYNDEPIPKMIDMNGSALSIGGIVMSGNKFIGCRVGIWLRKDGSLAIGVN